MIMRAPDSLNLTVYNPSFSTKHTYHNISGVYTNILWVILKKLLFPIFKSWARHSVADVAHLEPPSLLQKKDMFHIDKA